MSLDCATQTRSGDTVEVARTLEDVERIRDHWLAMQQHPHADLDFNLMLASVRDEIKSLHSIVVHFDGELKSILVGRIEKRPIPFKIGYKTVSRPFARILAVPSGGILGEQSERIARLQTAAVLRTLKGGDVDAVILSLLKIDSPLFGEARNLSGFRHRDSFTTIERNFRVSLPGDMDDFLMREKPRHRRELRRYGRVLERRFEGRVEYRCYQTAEHVPILCRHVEEISRNTYQRGVGAGFIHNPESELKLSLWAEKKRLRGYVLYIDAEPVAYWIGAHYAPAFYLDTTGYKPGFRKHNPGTVLYLKMVEDLCRIGVGEIDNGIGDSFWKQRFGAECTDKSTIFIYAPTIKGMRLKAMRDITTSISAFVNKMAKRTSMKKRVVKLARCFLVSRAKRNLLSGR